MSVIELVLLCIILISAGSIVVTTLRIGISPMPSSPQACKAIRSLIPENTTGSIVDLGSGWGNIVFFLSRAFPKARVTGIELSWIPWLFSHSLHFVRKQPNLKLERNDFRKVDLADVSIVVCYLFPAGMKQLQEKLQRELKPGTIVISNTFQVAGWTPQKTLFLRDLYNTPIYFYRTPPTQ